jgi:hypothetical protein
MVLKIGHREFKLLSSSCASVLVPLYLQTLALAKNKAVVANPAQHMRFNW